MYTTPDLKELRFALDSSQVPMFAAERPSSRDPFEFIHVNRANVAESGIEARMLVGKTPDDVLPPPQARAVISRYDDCLRRRQPLRYVEHIDLGRGPRLWSVTIQPVHGAAGWERIVGSAIELPREHDTHHLERALDDVRFLSAQADMQMAQLQHGLDILRDDADPALADRLDRLIRLCRGLERSVADLREASSASELPDTSPPAQTSHSMTVRVLAEASVRDI